MSTGDRVATVIGGAGGVVVLAHVVLGAAVVPPLGAIAGALVLVVGLGLHVLLGRRAARGRTRSGAVAERSDRDAGEP